MELQSNNQPLGDNQTPSSPGSNSPKILGLPRAVVYIGIVCIVVAAVLGLALREGQKPSSVKQAGKPDSNSTFAFNASSTASDVQVFKTNALSKQFPSDFPNPSKEGDVLQNNSMVVKGVSSSVNQSFFKFTSTQSQADLIKLYQDYMEQHGWGPLQRQEGKYILVSGKKNGEILNVSVSREPNGTSVVNCSIISPLGK